MYKEKPNSAPFIFFGSYGGSVIVLNELKKAGFVPSLVVAPPDTPQGRHLVITPPETKVWAEENNIPAYQPETLRGEAVYEKLNSVGAVYFVVAAYGKIIPANILALPKFGVLNIHPSLLPKHRGPTPIESSLLLGDDITGVSIMLLDEEVDHGDILAQETESIPQTENFTSIELAKRLWELGSHLLIQTIPGWLSGDIKSKEQDHSQATFTKKLVKSDGEINLTDNAHEIFNKYRAYFSWPGIYFFTERNGKKIRVIIKHLIYKNGQIEITRVIPEGGKEMTYQDFLRGQHPQKS